MPRAIQSAEVEGRLISHPVLNPKEPNNVRIVFDCVAEPQGVSLNECINSEPGLKNDLVEVLYRARKSTYKGL